MAPQVSPDFTPYSIGGNGVNVGEGVTVKISVAVGVTVGVSVEVGMAVGSTRRRVAPKAP